MSRLRLAAYAAFFAIGLVELRFQWDLLFDLDRSGMVQYYFESLLIIPPLAIFGCWWSFRSSDPVLRVIAWATIFAGLLQLLGEVPGPSQRDRDVMNGTVQVRGVK